MTKQIQNKVIIGLIALAIVLIGMAFALVQYRTKSMVRSKLLTSGCVSYSKKEKVGRFWEYTCSTPNVSRGKNDVEGIVLHHTATPDYCTSLRIMAGPRPKGRTSCHVLIDKDGTRYVLAPPEAITWHAGYSILNGRNHCNSFTIGIEFQGNTCKEPLTDEQIESALDYCLPIIKKYGIKESNIVTHQFVRDAYIKRNPKKKVPAKPDIKREEYDRFIKALHDREHELKRKEKE